MQAAPHSIRAIAPSDSETWEGKWFLTLDLDWAVDAILMDTLELLAACQIPSTIFITHETPLIDEMRSIPDLDLGIHPNFNRLLEGQQGDAIGAEDVLSHLMDIVPEARCVRSHSLAQSSRLHDVFSACGLTHDLNTLIPSGSPNDVVPWLDWNQMIHVPHSWEDDVHLMFQGSNRPEVEPGDLIQEERRFCVFNFHPIHVFLNTERIERYEGTRHIHRDPATLREERYRGYGTRSRLLDLLNGEPWRMSG